MTGRAMSRSGKSPRPSPRALSPQAGRGVSADRLILSRPAIGKHTHCDNDDHRRKNVMLRRQSVHGHDGFANLEGAPSSHGFRLARKPVRRKPGGFHAHSAASRLTRVHMLDNVNSRRQSLIPLGNGKEPRMPRGSFGATSGWGCGNRNCAWQAKCEYPLTVRQGGGRAIAVAVKNRMGPAIRGLREFPNSLPATTAEFVPVMSSVVRVLGDADLELAPARSIFRETRAAEPPIRRPESRRSPRTAFCRSMGPRRASRLAPGRRATASAASPTTPGPSTSTAIARSATAERRSRRRPISPTPTR